MLLPNAQPTAYEKLSALPDTSNSDAEATIEAQQQADEEQTRHDEFFDFRKAKPFLKSLNDDFEREIIITTANRERRRVDINIKEEQDAGRLKKSDTFIPIRVIDESIAREKPSYVAYLQQSRRLAIFSDVQNPSSKHDALEGAFTRGMQYRDWLTAHNQVIDGGQLNGWDWAEVLFDTSKPLLCSVEHVGHDRLIFPLDAEDIQNCARVLRHYRWTRLQLNHFVKKNGFSAEQVRKLTTANQQKGVEGGNQRDHVFNVYKLYFKYDDVVYVAWCCLEACDDWLSAPVKFYNGVDQQITEMQERPPIPVMDPMGGLTQVPQPPTPVTKWVAKDETEYPFCIFCYEVTEQEEINKAKGRAFKDKFKQEAMTAGWTGYLNAHNRAMMIMGSKTDNDGKPAAQLQNLELKDGAIFPFNIAWRNMPYPDPSMLQALQVFDAKIASGNGQMTYAVQSKSSGARTSATEVESAEKDTSLLASVNVSLFSSYVRNCYSKAWLIVQSQALQDNIDLLGELSQGPPNPITGMPDSEPVFVNNHEVIGRKFDIKPAGDTDYIRRQELISAMMQFWPVVQNTPIAGDFLAHLLKTKFGELGDLWAQKLLAGDVKTMLLMQCAKILAGLAANPAEATQMTPVDQQNLQMLLAEIQQALTPTTPPDNANARAANTTQPSSPTGGGSQPGKGPMDATSPNKQMLPESPGGTRQIAA